MWVLGFLALGIVIEAAFSGVLVSPGAQILGIGAVLLGAIGWRSRSFRVFGPALVCLGLFLVYLGNNVVGSSGDNLGTRALPVAVLSGRGVDVTGIPPLDTIGRHYSVISVDGKLVPTFPLGTPILATPCYALFGAATNLRDLTARIADVEKLSAACLAASSLVIFAAALIRWVGRERARIGTLTFGLASPLLSSASQGLWSFTGEIFLFSISIALIPGRSTAAIAGAGLSVGLAFLCRPTAIIPGVVFGLLILRSRCLRATKIWLACVSFGVLISIGVNMALTSRPLAHYGVLNLKTSQWSGLQLAGFLGNLISPSRGLLVWCPWVVMGAIVVIGGRVPSRAARLARAGLMSVASVWVMASLYSKWWGGYSIGPRLLSEAAPFLGLLAACLVQKQRRGLSVACLLAVGVSAGTHVLATYRSPAQTWNEVADVDNRPASLWSWADSQLAAAWLPHWIPSQELRDLAVMREGREDDSLAGSIDSPGEGSVVGGRLLARGWARIPGEDLEAIVRIDTAPPLVPVAFRRVARPDVCAVLPQMGDCSSAGWEAEFVIPVSLQGRRMKVTAIFVSKDRRYRKYPSSSFFFGIDNERP